MCVPPSFPAGSLKSGAQRVRGVDVKEKVLVVIGATGTGKSRLAIDVARNFRGEVVNSDKMQVYYGLDIVTNKVTAEERSAVPHHLLGVIPPRDDFTAPDFRREAAAAVDEILSRGRLPIIAGGSNSFVEELIEGGGREFLSRRECCFLWVDVRLPVLHRSVAERVDRMVEKGMVEEVRSAFDPDDSDYSRGIRRAIGMPELDRYMRTAGLLGEAERERILREAVAKIKANTRRLTLHQLEKIRRLTQAYGWDVHRVDATEAVRRKGEAAEEAWEEAVAKRSFEIVRRFLAVGDGKRELKEKKKNKNKNNKMNGLGNKSVVMGFGEGEEEFAGKSLAAVVGVTV
ncbi:adenylate isopentenyltransferase 5, chloroplastic-like [Typha angustifolia]|uniref:adenylate isopentenyltransferase 5, chloroplastic-like n=1 Tax=Typha angustifolia TaxID=59011 RepID=UPI003C306FBD